MTIEAEDILASRVFSVDTQADEQQSDTEEITGVPGDANARAE